MITLEEKVDGEGPDLKLLSANYRKDETTVSERDIELTKQLMDDMSVDYRIAAVGPLFTQLLMPRVAHLLDGTSAFEKRTQARYDNTKDFLRCEFIHV